ncbi:hypothetical protein [Acidocella aminolytica]|uniref:Uncharacterized protein n=1 Tax=Acidocella aminolytica 101 = DSM 11237 TaxID=1120923 RepID=A0A0D6PHQ2_9PROT|nr:hypothetical protein [Acidocella aminolytica]GAN80364.1 hypothetical protein Aam_046_005 [Acidocella aminolytica 101 = DSM 11237]GBQ37386.1 hypothetical protein AA11237_1511 [Acidocella aminolytica 101 = DSM 11237]SHF60550.1 hypothetical protein SAMN02746095_03844 [Acidocella aminolytica 101 = DSM 11237]
MNEEYEIELPGDAVPDDIETYLERIPEMAIRVRIDQANTSFSKYNFFTWSSNRVSVLPPDQREKINDLLNTADYVDFSCMSPQLKQILWKGVRFYYGLSEQEFPFPESLKGKLFSVSSRKTRASLRSAGIIVVIVFAFFSGALIGNTVGKIQSRPDSSFPSEAVLPEQAQMSTPAATAKSVTAESIPKFITKASQSQH